MKKISTIITFLLLVLSVLFVGYRLWIYSEERKVWGDEMFEINDRGDYYFRENNYVKQKYIIQTYEGTIMSRNSINIEGQSGMSLEIKLMNNDELVKVFIPGNLNMKDDKKLRYVDIDNDSNNLEFDSLELIDSQIAVSKGIYLELLYTADADLNPAYINNFVIVDNI